MSSEQVITFLGGVNWDMFLGFSVVPLFLVLATYYLIRGEWPWDKKYRSIATAGMFLFLAACSATGISGISGAFWTFFWVGGLGYLIRAIKIQWVNWIGNLPLAGQTYQLRGIGEVAILKVTDGESPFHSQVFYRAVDGRDYGTFTLTFIQKANFLSEREIGVEPI